MTGELRGGARNEEGSGGDPAGDRTAGMQQAVGETWAEREIEPGDRPGGERAEGGERERPANRPRDAGTLGAHPRTTGLGDRLGERRDQAEQDQDGGGDHDVGDNAGRREEIDDDRGQQGPGTEPAEVDGAGDERDPACIAGRVKLEQCGSRGAQGRAGRESLERAGREQPAD